MFHIHWTRMRIRLAALASLLAMVALTPVVLAQSGEARQETEPAAAEMHRYLVMRTFPEGALAGLDKVAKDKVNATNAKFGVRWIRSYANADLTKTFCIYEGPSEEAVRKAAGANQMNAVEIIEIPVDLLPRRAL